MQSVVEKLHLAGVIPVVTLNDPEKAGAIGGALKKGGLFCAEVAFRTKEAPAALEKLCAAHPDILAGAGTVLTPEDARKAVDAGARFIVSPGFTTELADWCAAHGTPFFPGTDSPSQMQEALSMGISTLKFFPAELRGGVKMLRAMAGPFQTARFIPTGGINAENIGGYMRLRNVVAAGGSWIVPDGAVEREAWDEIAAGAEKAVLAVHGFEFRHIGINSADEARGAEAARFFASLGFAARETDVSWFTGDRFEIMKRDGRGGNGHIAIACNNIERALAFFRRKGFAGDESTARRDGGGLSFIYLDKEINGFAIHLVAK